MILVNLNFEAIVFQVEVMTSVRNFEVRQKSFSFK